MSLEKLQILRKKIGQNNEKVQLGIHQKIVNLMVNKWRMRGERQSFPFALNSQSNTSLHSLNTTLGKSISQQKKPFKRMKTIQRQSKQTDTKHNQDYRRRLGDILKKIDFSLNRTTNNIPKKTRKIKRKYNYDRTNIQNYQSIDR